MNESLPMPVKTTPYRHQQEAFRFICDKFGIIDGAKKSSGVALLMDMGCGKSLTAIAGVGILFQYGLIGKALVVAPLSLLGMWRDEFQRFADLLWRGRHGTLRNGGKEKAADHRGYR